MISKHMALVGDALSHVALPGLALGLIFDFNPFLGAFAFVAAAMAATWFLGKITTLSVDAIVGVLFVLSLALGIMITPQPDLLDALFGDISQITTADALLTVTVSALIIAATRAIYNKLALSMISTEIAVSSGVNVGRINLIYLLLVAVVVAIGIKEVGTLLVGAVVIVPAAAARNVSYTLRGYSILSAVLGALSAISGVTISYYTGIPAGPLVVISGAVVFAAGIAMLMASGRRKKETGSLSTLN